MYGIRVEDAGTLVRVGMGGEFDACSLADLKAGLDDACGSGRAIVVDLSASPSSTSNPPWSWWYGT